MFNLDKYEYFEDLNLGLIKHTPKEKIILDVACGQGLLGEAFKKNGNEVYGIDWAEDVTGTNKRRLDHYFSADITNFKTVSKLLGRRKFDVIIFADILEHIYDPVGALNFYQKYLKSNGLIYISVPNLVVWNTRFQILGGNFYYWPAGTQDKTHIRFFTQNNLKKLIKVTNLQFVNLDITPGMARYFTKLGRKFFKSNNRKFSRRAIMDSNLYRFYVKYIYPFEYFLCKLWPGMFAFQYIAIVRKKR